jgi:hypothetical protein
MIPVTAPAVVTRTIPEPEGIVALFVIVITVPTVSCGKAIALSPLYVEGKTVANWKNSLLY